MREAQHRWRPIGDGYQPQAGDWVMFDGHVEVVTSYANGVLDTIGGDSLPDFSVNAHQYGGPLAAQGVTGFVNNGDLADAASPGRRDRGGRSGRCRDHGHSGCRGPFGAGRRQAELGARWPMPPCRGLTRPSAAQPGAQAAAGTQPASAPSIPGLALPGTGGRAGRARRLRPGRRRRQAPDAARPPAAQGSAATSAIPGIPAAADATAAASAPAAPSVPAAPAHPAAGAAPYRRHQPTATPAAPQGSSQQTFISAVAAGAIAAQRRYGVPAAVTIAQAIDESGWGQSALASRDHNLFGIKGIGPAGSDRLPTQEYVNGQSVTVTSSFRVYRNDAESIDDHGRLLATSGYYRQAMSYRQNPNAFASALTGVYATDPHYGAKIISLMSEYDLYQYDSAAPAPAAKPTAGSPGSAGSAGSSIPGVPATSPSAAPSPSGPRPPRRPGPPRRRPPRRRRPAHPRRRQRRHRPRRRRPPDAVGHGITVGATHHPHRTPKPSGRRRQPHAGACAVRVGSSDADAGPFRRRPRRSVSRCHPPGRDDAASRHIRVGHGIRTGRADGPRGPGSLGCGGADRVSGPPGCADRAHGRGGHRGRTRCSRQAARGQRRFARQRGCPARSSHRPGRHGGRAGSAVRSG